jgi:hypothetical protein
MKRIYNGLLMLLTLFAFASCENFMDIHKKYIEGGEIIYAPKVDSMVFIAGNHRLQFRYWLYKSPNVRTVDLYWNSGRDSLILPVSPTAGIDSFSVIIPNLDEQSYTFDVRTTDSYGHKSLYMTNFGSVYGENYQSSLAERRINSVDLVEKDGIVQGAVILFPASTGWVRTEVHYTKNDGTTGIASAKVGENTVYCPYVKPGITFEARSLYIPETEAVDTFATTWIGYEKFFPSIYQYDRSKWKVLEVSDETASDGGGKNTLIDGNLGSYWHSKWDGGNAPLPHWAIIDMQTPRNVTNKIDVYRRPGNTDAKTVEIYLSNTPDADGEWTKIGDGQFSSGDLLTIIPSDKVTKGRYLKILLPDSNRDPFTSIAEIYLYGGM